MGLDTLLAGTESFHSLRWKLYQIPAAMMYLQVEAIQPNGVHVLSEMVKRRKRHPSPKVDWQQQGEHILLSLTGFPPHEKIRMQVNALDGRNWIDQQLQLGPQGRLQKPFGKQADQPGLWVIRLTSAHGMTIVQKKIF